MTYCLAIRVNAGLVFASDSRTNAGIDHVSAYSKMHTFVHPGERAFVLLSAGNLATTQGVVRRLKDEFANRDPVGLAAVSSLTAAADHVGRVSTEFQRHQTDRNADQTSFEATFILGGQIAGEAPRLFSIYAAGNFIEATPETPYFQIGESKYGKPIIDRVLRPSTPMAEAAKCALISMDSTIRSNLSVGPPLDLLTIRSGELKIAHRQSIDATTPYFQMIRSSWGQALRHAFDELPNPEL